MARALSQLEENDEYINCLNRIAALQQPILREIADGMRETLSQFLPAVRRVDVEISQEQRFRAMRQSCQIVVDDGTPTLLGHKGDGVQSLAALAIMRHATDRSAHGRSLVVAIEEPESHLHPNAIHELRAVLSKIEERNQVVLTTHNPLFVDRAIPSNNVIVHKTKARAAKSVDEIRKILGVRASDNLRQAELVLVVEGEDDRVALTALLAHGSNDLKQALRNKTLALDVLGGASKLSLKLAGLRDALCRYHALLDDDREGHQAAERAVLESLISDANVNFSVCKGKSESELEDLFEPTTYAGQILDEFRVDILKGASLRGARKWSLRMKNSFKAHGKAWSDRVERRVKQIVAGTVARRPGDAISQHHASALTALIHALEARLAGIQAASLS